MSRPTCASCAEVIAEPVAAIEIRPPDGRRMVFVTCSACATAVAATLSQRRRPILPDPPLRVVQRGSRP